MNTFSPALGELAAALSAAQAEFGAVPKDSANPFFHSKYASLASVVASASPVLTKHGLSVSQFIGSDERGDTLTTWLLHKSGQHIVQSMRLHPAKQDAQGQGSAVTYARRYSYMAVLGLVADDDDDGQAAVRKPTVKPEPKPAGPEPITLDMVFRLKDAAEGLTPDQIKMAFAACGVEASAWGGVPRDKTAGLIKELTRMKRAG